MSALIMATTVIATEIAQAVAADEQADGCDLSAGLFGPKMSDWVKKTAALLVQPIDMVLHCPECGLQHIDAASDTCVHDACPHDTPCSRGACRDPWTNRPHKTHLCASCGHKWRPCDTHHTNGVQAVPPGSSDSPVVPPLEADGMLIRLGSNREVIYSQHYRNGTIAITTSLKVKRSR